MGYCNINGSCCDPCLPCCHQICCVNSLKKNLLHSDEFLQEVLQNTKQCKKNEKSQNKDQTEDSVADCEEECGCLIKLVGRCTGCNDCQMRIESKSISGSKNSISPSNSGQNSEEQIYSQNINLLEMASNVENLFHQENFVDSYKASNSKMDNMLNFASFLNVTECDCIETENKCDFIYSGEEEISNFVKDREEENINYEAEDEENFEDATKKKKSKKSQLKQLIGSITPVNFSSGFVNAPFQNIDLPNTQEEGDKKFISNFYSALSAEEVGQKDGSEDESSAETLKKVVDDLQASEDVQNNNTQNDNLKSESILLARHVYNGTMENMDNVNEEIGYVEENECNCQEVIQIFLEKLGKHGCCCSKLVTNIKQVLEDEKANITFQKRKSESFNKLEREISDPGSAYTEKQILMNTYDIEESLVKPHSSDANNFFTGLSNSQPQNSLKDNLESSENPESGNTEQNTFFTKYGSSAEALDSNREDIENNFDEENPQEQTSLKSIGNDKDIENESESVKLDDNVAADLLETSISQNAVEKNVNETACNCQERLKSLANRWPSAEYLEEYQEHLKSCGCACPSFQPYETEQNMFYDVRNIETAQSTSTVKAYEERPSVAESKNSDLQTFNKSNDENYNENMEEKFETSNLENSFIEDVENYFESADFSEEENQNITDESELNKSLTDSKVFYENVVEASQEDNLENIISNPTSCKCQERLEELLLDNSESVDIGECIAYIEAQGCRCQRLKSGFSFNQTSLSKTSISANKNLDKSFMCTEMCESKKSYKFCGKFTETNHIKSSSSSKSSLVPIVNNFEKNNRLGLNGCSYSTSSSSVNNKPFMEEIRENLINKTKKDFNVLICLKDEIISRAQSVGSRIASYTAAPKKSSIDLMPSDTPSTTCLRKGKMKTNKPKSTKNSSKQNSQDDESELSKKKGAAARSRSPKNESGSKSGSSSKGGNSSKSGGSSKGGNSKGEDDGYSKGWAEGYAKAKAEGYSKGGADGSSKSGADGSSKSGAVGSSKGGPAGSSKGGPAGSSKGGADGSSKGGADGYSKGFADGYAKAKADNSSKSGADGSSKGGADGSSKGGPAGSSKGGADGSSKGGADGSSKGGADGYSKGGADGYSKGGADGYSKGFADGFAKAKAEGYSKGGADGSSKSGGKGSSKYGGDGYLKGGADGYLKGGADSSSKSGGPGSSKNGGGGPAKAGADSNSLNCDKFSKGQRECTCDQGNQYGQGNENGQENEYCPGDENGEENGYGQENENNQENANEFSNTFDCASFFEKLECKLIENVTQAVCETLSEPFDCLLKNMKAVRDQSTRMEQNITDVATLLKSQFPDDENDDECCACKTNEQRQSSTRSSIKQMSINQSRGSKNGRQSDCDTSSTRQSATRNSIKQNSNDPSRCSNNSGNSRQSGYETSSARQSATRNSIKQNSNEQSRCSDNFGSRQSDYDPSSSVSKQKQSVSRNSQSTSQCCSKDTCDKRQSERQSKNSVNGNANQCCNKSTCESVTGSISKSASRMGSVRRSLQMNNNYVPTNQLNSNMGWIEDTVDLEFSKNTVLANSNYSDSVPSNDLGSPSTSTLSQTQLAGARSVNSCSRCGRRYGCV